MIRVYDFNCWMSDDNSRVAIDEIEHGRRYYNNMIGALNVRVQEELPYIEEAVAGLLGESDHPGKGCNAANCKLKNCPHKAHATLIYRAIKRHAFDVRKEFSAANSGCYTGTYHAVQASFDAAIGSKRKGTWPGEPYHFRRMRDNRGATCGVHLQGGHLHMGRVVER